MFPTDIVVFPTSIKSPSKLTHILPHESKHSIMKTILFLTVSLLTSISFPTEEPLTEAIKTAEAFVQLVDVNDAAGLQKILHPEMMQFAKIGDKLMPMNGSDFVSMVADKKLGGHPRAITLKNVQLVRGETIDIILQAVSEEYDFMYQVAMAKEADQWLILTVLTDIKPLK